MLNTFRNQSLDLFSYDYSDRLFENDLKASIPEAFLFIGLLILLLYAVPLSSSKTHNYPVLVRNASWIALLTIFCTQILLFNNPIQNATIFYNLFVLDGLSLFVKQIVLAGSLFSILISLRYKEQESLNRFEFELLILISAMSMLFLVSARDFISMYLAIELQSLCFYILAGIKRDSEFSTEAGLKYFLLGAFSSGILLFGLALQYGFTGTTNLSELCKIFQSQEFVGVSESIFSPFATDMISLRGCELSMIFILVGLLFKLSAVPFHMWAPDVYEGAPLSVTAFFAIVPKVSVLAVLLRFGYEGFYDFMVPWQKMLILSSIASMLLGTLAALAQNKMKRLLAYSSITHVGYLLIAVCCGTVEGIQSLLVYLVIYLVITINIFTVVLAPVRRYKINLNKESETQIERIKYTTDLAFCAKTNPILAITITLALFSIAGIPPLAGFYSKAFLVFAAMSAQQYVLAGVAIITSVISCFYYIRIIKIMYFEFNQNWLTFMRIPKESAIVLGLTFTFILFFCLSPTVLFLATHKIALSFCF